jgi:hypothetical protein
MPPPVVRPQNYFLNETHELSVESKEGGGPPARYPDIDWNQKSKVLHQSLQKVARRAAQSRDPLSTRKYYIIADPAQGLEKFSKAKDASANQRKPAPVVFNGEQSKLFERAGLDLIEVHPSGAATVHASADRMEQLLARTEQLSQLGVREQSRFVAFEDFEWLEGKLKYDQEWLDELGQNSGEGLIQLQPFITEIEADLVFRALTQMFQGNPKDRLRGKGRSYMGRYHLRALLTPGMIQKIADEFTSVQSIHAPIVALASALPPEIGSSDRAVQTAPVVVSRLPCVGILDTAIPTDHEWLAPYRRGGPMLGTNCANEPTDSHGSVVATRVVYGDVDLSSDEDLPPPSCRFLEIRLGNGQPNRIRSESAVTALAASLIAAPDVRVFNISFDSDMRLDDMPTTNRKETLKLIEEIDNLAFDRDVLIVIAAGNSPGGQAPSKAYPHHYDDPAWELLSYPRAFNALTCGGIARRLVAGGVATELDVDAPSPFTRVGPGFGNSPKPDFCESAGDGGKDYRPLAGGGVWGLDHLSFAKETNGTSFAAPLLAREAAFVLQALQAQCSGDTKPFACTAKAVLAISATDVSSDLQPSLHKLAKRTLGHGLARSEQFIKAPQQRARFVWQGIIEHEKDIVRVQVPVPRAWLKNAISPKMRMCVAWDTPVNAAAELEWGCRDVEVKLFNDPEAQKGLKGSNRSAAGYPLFIKSWNLAQDLEDRQATSDLWVVELSYMQQAAYSAGTIPTSSQRVAFVAELWDEAEQPVDPHSYVQGLPIASSFNRLSNTSVWLGQPAAIVSEF